MSRPSFLTLLAAYGNAKLASLTTINGECDYLLKSSSINQFEDTRVSMRLVDEIISNPLKEASR